MLSIWVKDELTLDDLKKQCWAGAINTLKVIEEQEKETELMQFLEVVFENDIPTMTELNDFLWFEDDCIFENLNIEIMED